MSLKVKFFEVSLLLVGGSLLLSSCGFLGGGGRPTSMSPGNLSVATGIAYNEDSSFQVRDFEGQPPAPNTVFIEGGRAVLGSFEEDLLNNTNDR